MNLPAAEPPLVDTHAHVYTTSMPLSGSAWHRPPHDATVEQYLATLDAHGVRFAVLAAASIFGDYNDYAIDAPRLPRPLAALEAAGVKIVVDHFGRADPARGIDCEGFQAVLRSVERGHTWVKLSAGFRLESPAAAVSYARELLKSAGPERLFWGSDWPFAAFESKVRYQDTIDGLTAWVPDPVARRRIGGVHIAEGFLDANGRFDTARARPMTRLGGNQYAEAGPIFGLPSAFTKLA